MVLIIDDDHDFCELLAVILRRAGNDVIMAHSLDEGRAALAAGGVEEVWLDVQLNGQDGLALLDEARHYHAQFVVVTGEGTLSMAQRAIDSRAVTLITKPITPGAVLAAAERVGVRRREAARIREAVAMLEAAESRSAHEAALLLALSEGLSAAWMAYQPILGPGGQVVAYEALLRSHDPRFPGPDPLLASAERLRALPQLGRVARACAAAGFPPGLSAMLFVNLHPQDLDDDALLADDEPLLPLAHQVVFEITERAALTESPGLRTRLARLRERGFRFAIDDLGAGTTGLASMWWLHPEFVKLDMSLVRGIDASVGRQKLVAALASVFQHLGAPVVAEGVETRAELDAVLSLGCGLVQGFFLGRPGTEFAVAA